jgi:hypothetical protein
MTSALRLRVVVVAMATEIWHEGYNYGTESVSVDVWRRPVRTLRRAVIDDEREGVNRVSALLLFEELFLLRQTFDRRKANTNAHYEHAMSNRNSRDPMEAMRQMREKMKDDLARQREAERLFRLEQQGQQVYHPSVFRYHCYGRLQLSTDRNGSEGLCHGMATRIEHVRDLQRSTRQQALDAFAPIPSLELTHDDIQHRDKGLLKFLERDAMIYESVDKEAPPNDATKEDDASYHDWDLYGSTEVEIIVLKHVDRQEDEIAAVVPRCTLGWSFRDAASKDHSFLYSDLHLGKNTVRLAGLSERIETEPKENSEPNQNASVTSINPSSMFTIENFQLAATKVAEKGVLIFTHAYQHSQFAVQEISSPEFPRKWYVAADRIVHQIPTTLHNAQTFTMWAYKAGYKWVSGDDSADDNND